MANRFANEIVGCKFLTWIQPNRMSLSNEGTRAQFHKTKASQIKLEPWTTNGEYKYIEMKVIV